MNLFKRKYTFTLIYTLLVLFGWLSFRQLAVEQLPNTDLPSVTVSYRWGRSSPEVMEQEITRKVEQIASRLPGIQDIRSSSQEGSARVTVTFQKNININLVQLEWAEQLKVLETSLPTEIRRGEMTRSVPDEVKGQQSFITYSVSGPISGYALKNLAQQQLVLPLSGITGLAKINLNGIQDPVLRFSYSAQEWNNLGLSIGSVLSELSQQFEWIGAGAIRMNGNRITLVSKPKSSELSELRKWPIKTRGDKWFTLDDLAQITIEDYPATYLRRINGQTALTIDFVKESGADALNLAELIHSAVAEIQKDLPEGVILRKEKDSTEKIRDEINALGEQSINSVLFVFILLLLIIRAIKAPILIVSNILFSLFFAFIGLQLLGQTLNTFTMAALTISIGMLVDNAIVVYDHLEKKIKASTIQEKREEILRELTVVVVPVIGNTLTTVGIFLPLLFSIPSLRYFLEPFGLALGLALIGSVLVSLSWIPFLFYYLPIKPKKKRKRKKQSWLKGLAIFWSIRYKLRWVILTAFVFTIGIPIYLLPDIKQEEQTDEISWLDYLRVNKEDISTYIGGVGYRFYRDISFGEPWKMPESESIYVNIKTPVGTPLEELDKIAKQFERVAEPFLTFMNYSESYIDEKNGAYLNFVFDKESVYIPQPYVLKGELMYLAARTGNSTISVSGFGDGFSNGGYSSGNSVSFEMTGFTYEALKNAAEELKLRLEQNSRVRDVDINKSGFWGRDDLFHYVMELDEQKMMQFGIKKASILAEIRSDVQPEAFYGRVIYDSKPVYIQAVNTDVSDRKDLFMNQLRLIDGVWIRLSELTKLEKEKTLARIDRTNQQYSRTISFEYLGSWEMGKKFQKEVVETVVLPVGIKLSIPDFWSRFRVNKTDESKNRWYVFAGSLVIVFLILAGLLNHFREALFTLSFVALGFLGVAWLSLEFDLQFGRGAYAGILLLGGVIVNNGLLLYHEQLGLKEKGIFGFRNALYVLRYKLRSVWLTSLTTIAGLLPLLIWSDDIFWSGMAFVVCAGMGFSTVMISLFWGTWVRGER